MLELLLALSLTAAPQELACAAPAVRPAVVAALGGGGGTAASAVCGAAELTPVAAYDSARQRATQQVRDRWQQRAEATFVAERPFWLPEFVARERVRTIVRDLPLEPLCLVVDREDRERQHEFGSSWQTTLWVAEDPQLAQRLERDLRSCQRALERSTLRRFGVTVVGWALLALGVGWFDRLTRGYATGRLRLLGFLLGSALPAFLFLR